MQSTRPYSFELMTRLLQSFESSGAPSYEGPVPNRRKDVRGLTASLVDSSSRLGDVLDTFDQQPAGWIIPEWSSSRYQHVLNLYYSSTSIVPNLIEPGTFSPDVSEDGSDSDESDSTGSTPASSVPTSPSVPTPESDEDARDSFDPSPLPVLRMKGRKTILKRSGVKPKTKAPRMRDPTTIQHVPNSSWPLEMIQCRWGECTQKLYVDYTNVNHWGKHIRTHCNSRQDMIRCEWGGDCNATIHKSSMWKHIVVHEERFKVRCPHGCGVSTRGDMLRRHLKSCNYTP